MEDIALVIKMPEKYYDIVKEQVKNGSEYSPFVVIAKGTPIDKYEPCITMSKAFANSVASVKMLEYENEELKNKINNIITEITDTGIHELEIHGQTDFYNGINYCLNTFDRNGLSINKINKEDEEK